MTSPKIPTPQHGLRLVAANTDYNRGGDAAYLNYLRATYSPAILFRQEVERGIEGTRIRSIGVRGRAAIVGRRGHRVLGAVGAHRGVAVAALRVDGRRVLALSVHGLHGRTVGRAAQTAFLRLLALWCASLTRRGRLWVVGMDANRPLSEVARTLGGHYAGSGVIGFVASPGVDLDLEAVDRGPIEAGWTNHPAVSVKAYVR